MKGLMIVFGIGLVILLCLSCKDTSADLAERSPFAFSFQSSKCMNTLSVASSNSDSLFLYSFTDTLVIDFSVVANCCPDSDRFSVAAIPGTDTIVVAVSDTAQSLCNCICPYMIHAEFANLPNDHYVVVCTLGQMQGERLRIHIADVYRDR